MGHEENVVEIWNFMAQFSTDFVKLAFQGDCKATQST